MIIITGHIIAKPEHRDDVLTLSLEHCQRSRAEAGCLDHRLSEDQERPNHFTFLEYWQDYPSLKAHFALAESQAFVKELRPLLAVDPDMNVFDAKAL